MYLIQDKRIGKWYCSCFIVLNVTYKKEDLSQLLSRKASYEEHCIKAGGGATPGHVITKS